MPASLRVVPLLVFASGLCALVYQTVWIRELRLVFGASTIAGAAVLAIFMAGLGCGAALLGRPADSHRDPLALYGTLECGIAILAAVTPFLIDGVRALYIASGGSVALGPAGATLLRLFLAAVVLAGPTLLMGGTLSAASRAVTTSDDPERRRVAVLYAANTTGAVVGALLAGFVMLERLGNRRTLWVAAALNLLVGVIARRVKAPAPSLQEATRSRRRALEGASLFAAAGSGVVFLLMELVWYRVLSPILGGTTFMFSLVLAVALAGIGIGGAIYAHTPRASAGLLAITLAGQALALAIPYALGDRIAMLAHALRDDAAFGAHVAGWALVTIIVALPASIVAGIQFPMFIALLGEGGKDVGRDVGRAYAWNTAGAIAGSLLGGFVLIPRLGAMGCWRLCVAALVILAAIFAWRARHTWQIATAAATGSAALVAIFTAGPTAVWRHSGIGAGRVPAMTSANDTRAWAHVVRRTLLAETEGRESSIALMNNDDLGLVVNGKSDGSARRDAGTQVMAGMIAALLHPDPRSAMVIGLGTGTTAGWLASVQSMERVDVVELEPAVVGMAAAYEAVNRNVLAHPRVHIEVNDARETLLVSRRRYDVIFSEPSNPYRAGVASLYTREFYEAVRARLARGGLFAQWVQTYSIDEGTAKTIYATISRVFPNVQTWTTNPGDVVLIASAEPITIDVSVMRTRLARGAFRDAAHVAWRVESPEGVLAHFIASEEVARTFASETQELNTDDRPVIEFGFARTVGSDRYGTADILAASLARNGDRPRRLRGRVEWPLVAASRASIAYLATPDPRNVFARIYAAGEFGNAAASWEETRWSPATSRQLATLAHALAVRADERALDMVEQLREIQPTEADAIEGILRARQHRPADAAPLIVRALNRYREDPWPLNGIMESALSVTPELASDGTVLDALSQPYAAYQLEEVRRLAYVAAAWQSGRCGPRTLGALSAMEPDAFWLKPILEMRALCYRNAGLTELAETARRELAEFEAAEPRVTSSSVPSARASPPP